LNVVLAENYGFCFGVKRAIDIATENSGALTLGSLIHNQKEIDRLENDYNVKTIEDIDNLENNSKVLIRTHGIPKNDLAKLKQKNSLIIDATCPFVTKPQQICQEMSTLGYQVIIFGDISHPEIKGVVSYSENENLIVISSAEDLKKQKIQNRVSVIAQTTKKNTDYKKIVNYLMDVANEVRVFNTICDATLYNQQAARKLSKEVDLMIIIGGKNSSNTKQLFDICKASSLSYLIEDEQDLDKDWFLGKSRCGITAGASTPQWIISNVIEKIKLF
jgi:4-hydroxy-3-methylbut-2-enyl diphosphate reductase